MASTAAPTRMRATSVTLVRVSSVPPRAPNATATSAPPSISGNALAATTDERNTQRGDL